MSEIAFLNAEMIVPIVIGAIILWSIFIYKEWDGQYHFQFWLKSLIGLIAIIALLLIFLKPTFLCEAKTDKAVLLTENYNESDLDSIKKEHKDIVILKYVKGEEIVDDEQKIASLIILGEGIQNYDLWQLNDFPTYYLGKGSINGITKLKYDQKNELGKELLIQGNYVKPLAVSKLILQAPGEIAVDSIILSNQKEQVFQLSTKLKVDGNFLYQLIEKDSAGKMIRSNPIPISVTKRVPLRIWMIEEFPTFENKYLKNYLAQSGQEVSVRTQLTTNRFKNEYFNIKNKQGISFSEEGLKSVDLLIIDEGSLKSISKYENSLLKRIIKDYGLGVFIQPTSELLHSKFDIANLKFKRDNNTATILDTNSRIQINKLPYRFLPDDGLQSIIFSEDKILAAYKKTGFGRIGTSVFENTYQLILDGNGVAYQNLWAKIIEALSRRENVASEFNTAQQFAFEDEPYRFTLRTSKDNPIVNSLDQGKIPMKQDIAIYNNWTGTVYPRNKGWNSLSLETDSIATLDYYVNDTEVWKSLQSQKTSEENERFFKKSNKRSTMQKFRKPINPLWFFGIFVLAMGYLWLAPKLTEA